jgi:hypothetical protein
MDSSKTPAVRKNPKIVASLILSSFSILFFVLFFIYLLLEELSLATLSKPVIITGAFLMAIIGVYLFILYKEKERKPNVLFGFAMAKGIAMTTFFIVFLAAIMLRTIVAYVFLAPLINQDSSGSASTIASSTAVVSSSSGSSSSANPANNFLTFPNHFEIFVTFGVIYLIADLALIALMGFFSTGRLRKPLVLMATGYGVTLIHILFTFMFLASYGTLSLAFMGFGFLFLELGTVFMLLAYDENATPAPNPDDPFAPIR